MKGLVIMKGKIYNPIWDKSRCTLDGRSYEDDKIILASNFECGNGYNFRKVGSERYYLEVEPEPGEHSFSNQGYYFCVAVLNKLDSRRSVTIEIKGGREIFADGGPDDQVNKHVIIKRGETWSHLPEENILPPIDKQTMAFELEIPAKSEADPVVYIGNFHWYPYSEMTEYLKNLADRHPEISLLSIGKSAQGRDVWAVELGLKKQNAPTIVCAQTPQPSEMGHWACRAILDFLVSGGVQAKGVLSKHRLCLVPHTNPDGTVMGYCVSDAKSHFPYFEADRAVQGRDDAPVEVVDLWNYLQGKKPWLFIEWHSNNWMCRARQTHVLLRYDKCLVSDPGVQHLWANFEDRLIAMPDFVLEGEPTNYQAGWITSIGFFTATKLNAISIMIKLHDKYQLERTMGHVQRCLLEAAGAYEECGGFAV